MFLAIFISAQLWYQAHLVLAQALSQWPGPLLWFCKPESSPYIFLSFQVPHHLRMGPTAMYVCFSNCILSSFLKTGAICFALYLPLELECISFWRTCNDDPETISGCFPGHPSLSLTACKPKWSRSCQTDEPSQFILNSLLSVCCHIN